MKVKRSSWHYKVGLLGSYESSRDNLCVHFWSVVIKIAVAIFVPSGLGIAAYYYFIDPFWVSTTIMLTFIFSAIGLPALAIYFLRKKLGKSPEIPGSNILIEYLKAKKAKICPLIEYVD